MGSGVKTTIKEYKDSNKLNKPYNYEITKIELLLDPGVSDESTNTHLGGSNSITMTKLLNGVEKSYDKGKFLLEESGTNRNIYSLNEEEQDEEYLDAVESGDLTKAQAMVDAKADAVLGSILLPDDKEEVGYKYHRGEAPKKIRKMYAVFNVNPDGFHAAYAGNTNATPVGVWLDAQNLKSYESSTVKFDDGTPATYIPGDTGKSTKVAGIDPASRGPEAIGKSWLLERGGKHGSDVPNFSQMNLGVNENGEKVSAPVTNGALPHNKLVFEIECGMSEDGDLTEYVKEHGRMMKFKSAPQKTAFFAPLQIPKVPLSALQARKKPPQWVAFE